MSWKEIKIGDLGRIVTGNTPPKKIKEFYGNAYKFIKPTDMNIGERFTPETEECYSELGFEKYKKSLIPPLSTCVVTIGSIGKKITLTETNSFVNQAVNAVIPNKEEFDPFFVFYILKNLLQTIKKADTGASSGRENVSKSNFMNIPILVPEKLSQQTKIAEILCAYDNLIENNIKRIKLLEEASQHLYKEWFVNFRFPGYEHIPLNNKTGLPEGWKNINASDLFDIQGGTQPPKSEWKESAEPDYIRMIQIRDYYTDSHIAYVKDSKKLRKCKKDDLMIARYGASVGRICWGLSGAYNVALAKLMIKKNVPREYIRSFVLSDYFQGNLIGMTQRTAQAGFNKNTFNSVPAVLPDSRTLQFFETLTSPKYKNIQILKDQNKKLVEAQGLLLPRLMNRTIEV